MPCSELQDCIGYKRVVRCRNSSPKLPMAVDTHVISLVSFLSQPQSKMDTPGTSSAGGLLRLQHDT